MDFQEADNGVMREKQGWVSQVTLNALESAPHVLATVVRGPLAPSSLGRGRFPEKVETSARDLD